MEIGLYQLKYPFRKLLEFLLPFCKNINPNTISVFLIPLGFLTALIYKMAPTQPAFYLVGIVCIFLRMIIGTLDGLVAETYHKQTPNGTILNRLTHEAADLMLMCAIIMANPQHLHLGIWALLLCWATSFLGLLGLAGGKKIQSVGPVGQTDRIVALMVFSLLQFWNVFGVDFITLFLWWVVLGGIITISLRAQRILTEPTHEHP